MRPFAAAVFALAACCACAAATSDVAPLPTAFPGCAAITHAPRGAATTAIDVPMRDCVTLSTAVTLPDGPGPFPVVLVRSPYGKSLDGQAEGFVPGIDAVFAPHGYAVVDQDVRGRFGSAGDFVPFLNERNDTEDTIAWIERQPWFDGNLGVWGASYLGATAILGAVVRPDLVKAAFVAIIRSDVYAAGFEHGILRADVGGLWAVAMAERDAVNLPPPEVQAEAMLNFPTSEADVRTVGTVAFDDVFFEHADDDQFWRDNLDPAEWRATDVPLFMFGGWFDFLARGQLNDWDAIAARRDGDLWFVVGPWTHMMGLQFSHDWDFPDGDFIGAFVPETVDFFDRYLKGDREAFAPPRVRWYDGGAGDWRSGDDLWPAATTTWTLYAAPPAATAPCAPRGRLGNAPAAAATFAYDYDPRDPVILNGAMILDLSDRAGMRREIDWCARADAISFDSGVLAEPLEIAGALSVRLRVASSAANTAFVVRLALVDVDGTAYNLREAAVDLHHRNGDDHAAAYTPGAIVALHLPLPSLRWTLRPGQRLRLVVTSSGYPFVVPHSNRDGNWMHARDPVVAHQTVSFGGNDGSALFLTVAH